MPRILVVEDDPSLRDFFVFDFESQGFETFVASDGAEALRILAETAVDAVVSDIQMPKVSGLDLARTLRVGGKSPTRPVIVLVTGHEEVLPDEAYALGVTAFLYKPFHRQELSKTVQDHLVGRAQRWVDPRALEGVLHYPKSGNLEIQVDQWSSGPQQRILSFGHGGIFIAMQDGFPDLNSRVDLRIYSGAEGEPLLEGVALVRWVRRLPNGDLLPGCGMEIIAMREPGASVLLSYLKKNTSVSYIPRS